MKDRFFLNSLRTASRSLEVPEVGEWKGDQEKRDFLIHYASDIDIDGHLQDIRLSHSTPSVFARPIQFHQALRAEKHPLRREVISQWRGLLSVFALKEWHDLPVRLRRYPLPHAPGSGADANLVTVLRSQLPEPKDAWDAWWLIYCDDALIGATSPWTIVFTPAEYRCPEAIPWSKGGLLTDPRTYYDPKSQGGSVELGLLHDWVTQLLERQASGGWGTPAPWQKYAMNWAQELTAWKRELAELVPSGRKPSGRATSPPLISDHPYSVFSVPLAKDGAVSVESDCELRSKKRVLVLPRAGLPPRDRVWKSVFADQVNMEELGKQARSSGGWVTKGGQKVDVDYVIPDDLFLPPFLVEIPLEQAAYTPDGNSYATPLTPAFFEYFSLDDLLGDNQMLQVADRGDALVVQLNLPLTNGSYRRVEKSYDKGKEVVAIGEVPIPALAIWPDFMASDWTDYWAIASAWAGGGGRRSKVQVQPLLKDGAVLPCTNDDGTQKTLRVWSNNQPIFGFNLLCGDERGNPRMNAGVVLLGQRQHVGPPDPQSTWNVAVDFGTSNTQVKVKSEGGDPTDFSWTARTVGLTRSEENRNNEIDLNFYPTVRQKPDLPIPTLLVNGAASVLSSPSNRAGIVREDAIMAVVCPAELMAEADRYVPNVKWGGGNGDKDDRLLKSYLGWLLRAVVAEARVRRHGEITIRWSYPLALPKSARSSMANFWASAEEPILKYSAVKCKVSESMSESEAICRYLVSIDGGTVAAPSLSVAVDVGGGSTDIGFWSRAQLEDCVSLKIAGNDLLVPFAKIDQFTQDLASICTGRSLTERQQDFLQTRPALALNLFLKEGLKSAGGSSVRPAAHPVPVALSTILDRSEAPWVFARSLIFLYFSGLFFYLGIHCQKFKTGIDQVTVYLAGRGSSLLSWVGTGREMEEALKFALQKGHEKGAIKVDVKGPALGSLSTIGLKEEVALGLLNPRLPRTSTLDSADVLNKTIVGETGWSRSNGQMVSWDALLSASELEDLLPPPNHESSYIARFMNLVVPKYAETFGLDVAGLRGLEPDSARISNALMMQAGSSGHVLEPVFAVELKTLMSQYVEASLRPRD